MKYLVRNPEGDPIGTIKFEDPTVPTKYSISIPILRRIKPIKNFYIGNEDLLRFEEAHFTVVPWSWGHKNFRKHGVELVFSGKIKDAKAAGMRSI